MATRPRFVNALLLSCLVLPAHVFAIDLGEIEIVSFAGQPLAANIEVTVAEHESIDNLTIELADDDAFKRAGLPRLEILSQLRFTLGTDASGEKFLLRVSTDVAFDETEINLVIAVTWPQGELEQHYRLLLEPPPAATDSGFLIEHKLDLYYSNIGIYIPLTDEPMREIVLKDEVGIYLNLLRSAFTPRFFLVEASVNPLPVLGTYLKKHHPEQYSDADVSSDVNLIQVLTEGFEEPYAVSLFVGNVIRFKAGEGQLAYNKGFSGFLFSIGDQHIKDSELIDDDWYEIEWKLKGDRRVDSLYHSWSFRIGSKIHENPDIADVSYFGIRRELFDGRIVGYAWNENIGIDLKLSFSRQSHGVVQQHIIVEKKWPLARGLFSLGVGLTKRDNKYSGALADPDDNVSLIIRPDFSF